MHIKRKITTVKMLLLAVIVRGIGNIMLHCYVIKIHKLLI